MQKKAVRVGNCVLDGKHIYIQSMLNTRSDDIAGSVAQAKALEQAGCEILRAAIPDKDCSGGAASSQCQGNFCDRCTKWQTCYIYHLLAEYQ